MMEMDTLESRMAIASRPTPSPRGALDPEDAAFAQFFGTLAASPSVERVAVHGLGGAVDLWVRLRDDDEANEMALYDALATYHATSGVTTLVDLHLVLASEPDSAFPAGLTVLYRRHP
jgi:hypothetical protein